MKLLLDTHVLFWWLASPAVVSDPARRAIDAADDVLVSAASAWEIAAKVRLGKWPQARLLIDDFSGHLAIAQFNSLPVTAEHARHAGLMTGEHKDPFDRLIAAQAFWKECPSCQPMRSSLSSARP